MKKNILRLTAIILACLLLSGCMFRDLKKEIAEEKISFRLYGRVENLAQTETHVYVLLYSQQEDKMQLERFLLPDDTGVYAFLITPGTYMVAGFEDQNNNPPRSRRTGRRLGFPGQDRDCRKGRDR